MSSDRFPCPVCDDTGLVRYDRTIGDHRRMPWTKACRCQWGDRYAGFMARISDEAYDRERGRERAA